jgi:OOP family OmpA-OmpF porin
MKKLILLSVLFIFGFSISVEAQILDRLAKKAEEKVKREAEERAEKRVNKGIDKVYDKTEEGIDESVKGDGQDTDNKSKEATEDTSQSSDTSTATKGKTQTPGLESYSKFDFIPGEKIIFFDDFTQDAVGDFPVQWNTNGSAEVVTTNLYEGKWMKFVMDQCVWTDELLKLPENYTIEFDIIPIGGLEGDGMSGYNFQLMQAKNAKAWDSGSAPGNGGFEFKVEYFGRPSYHTWLNTDECAAANLNGHLGDNDDKKFWESLNQKYHISIWVQKSRIRLYQNQNKIIDLPKAFPTGCLKPDRIRFQYGGAMISNVRVAVGAPDMRSKLITEGKLVSYGIYFDVNKDVVKPESYGTLKEIATVLKENPDVKVKIVGHTDSDGADVSNLDLSKRRGAAVKNALVKDFGIDATRLESDGAGESQPVAPNDSSANKALNRRVEFIKL